QALDCECGGHRLSVARFGSVRSFLFPIVSFCAAFGLDWAGTSAQADEPEQFRAEKLAVPGRVQSVHPVDLNGDGQRDLLVVFATGGADGSGDETAIESRAAISRRWIALYYSKQGLYGVAPAQKFEVPEEASFVSVIDLDGDKKLE